MFIKVNDIDLFYQKSGLGQPIILLHGNGESHAIFDTLIEQLSPKYSVYAIDSRDHGQSSKVKSLDYMAMMEDVLLFIKKLNIYKPVLYGFSDGGILGLLLASRYPDLLSKLIISGANTTPFGIKNRYLVMFSISYLITKDDKTRLMLTQPHISAAALKKITVPTFVLAGSKDIIKEKNTRFIANHIPNSLMRILRNETHDSYIIHSKILYEIIAPFLSS